MMMANSLIIFIVLLSSSICSAKHDDAKCDRELSQLERALDKREQWALKCQNRNLSAFAIFQLQSIFSF